MAVCGYARTRCAQQSAAPLVKAHDEGSGVEATCASCEAVRDHRTLRAHVGDARERRHDGGDVLVQPRVQDLVHL